jgi:hypothetical protein
LLDTGEIKLGNGKIIGHRELWYIYKQKYRMPDNREAVMINKLAMEYRKLRQVASIAGVSNINAMQIYQGLKQRNEIDNKTIRAW